MIPVGNSRGNRGPRWPTEGRFRSAREKAEIFKPIRIDEPAAGDFRLRFRAKRLRHSSPQGPRPGRTKNQALARRTAPWHVPRRNDGRGLVNPAGVGNPNYWQYTLRGGLPKSGRPNSTTADSNTCRSRARFPRAIPIRKTCRGRGTGLGPRPQRRRHGRALSNAQSAPQCHRPESSTGPCARTCPMC